MRHWRSLKAFHMSMHCLSLSTLTNNLKRQILMPCFHVMSSIISTQWFIYRLRLKALQAPLSALHTNKAYLFFYTFYLEMFTQIRAVCRTMCCLVIPFISDFCTRKDKGFVHISSLLLELDHLKVWVTTTAPDVLVISETWLRNSVPDTEVICLSGQVT